MENQVLGDADLIDANFGLVAVWRFITIRAGHQSSPEETVAAMAEWLPRKDELMRLLNTGPGIAVARERSACMHRFCQDLAAAFAEELAVEGLREMVRYINANCERGSLEAQLPRLRELVVEADDSIALTACERLKAEMGGEA